MGMALGTNVGKLMAHKRLTNGDVSRGAGIPDPQTVFAMVKRKSKKSDHAAALARFFNVPLDRLMADDFDVAEADAKAEQPPANYETLTPEARDVALAWMRLTPPRQQAIREWVFLESVLAKSYPWLLPGKPTSQSYIDYEKAVEADIVRITKRLMMQKDEGEK